MIQRGDRFFVRCLGAAHSRFTAACRVAGLTATDHPLNQDENGGRSLGNLLRRRVLEGFAQSARASLNGRLKPASALRSGAAVVFFSK